MKKRISSALCLFLALLCLLCSCKKTNVPEPLDLEIPDAQPVTYTYKTDVDERILCTSGAGAYLILANKEHPLPAEYTPSDLSAYAGKTYNGKEVLLDARVGQAVLLMVREMEADGVTDLFVTSGYRSYTYQKQLFAGYINQEMRGISKEARAYFGDAYIAENYTNRGITGLNRADATLVVRSYSAEAGYSEHQTGLCVDFITSSMAELDRTFEQSDAFRWLSENAYRFGFLLRYPEEKETVTGYSYEPWHYRFVGREAATAAYFAGQTLEEFLLAND